MFRYISLTGFVLAFATIAWAYRSQPEEFRGMSQWWGEQIKNLRASLQAWASRTHFKSATYRATLLLFALLALTGFLPLLIFGQTLSGFPLMIHVTIAPLFAIGAVALALLYAQRQTYNQSEWDYLRQLTRRKLAHKNIFAAGLSFWKKTTFWLLLLFAVPLLTSVVLMMYPWFGTHGQHTLLQWHRYSSFVMTLVLFLHLYLITLEHYRAEQPR